MAEFVSMEVPLNLWMPLTHYSHFSKWPWFQSQICTGGLQWHLCEVRGFKTAWSGNMVRL